MTQDIQSSTPHAFASGHAVGVVAARNEPPRHHRRALADLSDALPDVEGLAMRGASIRTVRTTPDFHPGRPVPVGVVVDAVGAVMPHLVGSDVGCGMRLAVLDGLREDDLGSPEIESQLRHVLFQGGRDVALTGRHRHAVLRDGLPGLVDGLRGDREGVLARLDLDEEERALDRTCDLGVFACDGVDEGFAPFAQVDDVLRRDAILGSLGGGNHFLEIGVVDDVVDGPFARAAGVRRGDVVLVAHTGSLDFGQRVGAWAHRTLPGDDRPGDRRVLSREHAEDDWSRYMRMLANAGNASFVNRWLVAIAGWEGVRRAVGRDIGMRLVYDAPHNMAWLDGDVVRHRKGACPARGGEAMAGSPYAHMGEPVILPGSMGDGTWLLKGLGRRDTAESSAHGAGRRLSRSEARRHAVLPAGVRVVGPVDPNAREIVGRADVRREIEGRLREESPGAYRSIDDVVEPMVAEGMVGRVARIRPVVTAKG